jgi:lipoprotein NlpI
LPVANEASATTRKSRVCQANFYIAEQELQHGANDDATRLFRLVVADCPRTLTEWRANAELNAHP